MPCCGLHDDLTGPQMSIPGIAVHWIFGWTQQSWVAETSAIRGYSDGYIGGP
jgi:hypothetical protein